MRELAKVIASDEFKQNQRNFFAQHCTKFDHEEENKLEYTIIHKEYEAMVEAQMNAAIGQEKMKIIELGLNDFIKSEKKGDQTDVEVYNAIEVLS